MNVITNKIDPIIVNTVHQQTVESVIHSSKGINVSKDKGENRGQHSNKGMKEKIDKFNSLLEVMDIDASFKVDGGLVLATDGQGNILKIYTKDALVELFSRMEDMIGVFIDVKR